MLVARKRRARCFRFCLIGEVPIDETSTAAAAGRQVLGLRVGFDDELAALAAWTAQQQMFHGALVLMKIVPSTRKNRSSGHACVPIEGFTGPA